MTHGDTAALWTNRPKNPTHGTTLAETPGGRVHGGRPVHTAECKISRDLTVILDRRNGPEPDVSVIRAAAVTGPNQMSFQGRDVLLAVEVVSPDSESRDRTTKPWKYAAAGIPNF